MGNLPLEVVFPMVKITRAQDISQAELFIDFYGHPREDELMTSAHGNIYVRFGSNADRSSPETQTCPLRSTAVDCKTITTVSPWPAMNTLVNSEP
jgi:hypothetical protein